MLEDLTPVFLLIEQIPAMGWVFIALFIFFAFACRWGERRHLLCRLEAARQLKRLKGQPPEYQMTSLRRVNPFVFEEMVLSAIKIQGHAITRNKRYTGDGGIDGRCVINGVPYLIQAKRYSAHINPAHVQDFARICQRHKAKGLFVHTGKTGAKSHSVAQNSKIEMISGQRLLNLLTNAPKD